MLNRISIEAALPIAQRLDERKLRVLPTDGSPLMSLTQATSSFLVEQDLADNADLISVLQARSGEDAHRVAKADIIKLASLSIARLHDITRTQVLPLIKEVAAEVQEYVSQRRIEASLPYSVVMKEIPAVYSNAALKQLAERYPQASQLEFAARNLAPVTLDRLKDLCKTGMAGFDAELATVLSLGNDEGYGAVLKVLTGQAGPHQIHVDYLPGVLVAAQAIYGEPEPGVNLTLVEYNDYLNRLLGKTAHLLRGAMMRYAEAEKLGTLYSTDGRDSLTTIVVMGKAYRALLEKGLTPEALIGNEMAGRRFSAGQLIENKAALEQIYNREMNLRSIKVQAEMTGIVRDALRQIVAKTIVARELGEGMEAASRKLQELAGKVNERNCDDINSLVTDVVCEVFFAKTDALTFIRLMNRAGASVPEDTDPREVALLATCKYVNYWLCRQMGLVQA